VSNVVESKTEIQIDVPLTEEAKLKCASEMLTAMSAISIAIDDMKDYQAERKEDVAKYEGIISQARSKNSEFKLSDRDKMACATEIIDAMNAMSEIEDDLRSYQTEKKAEIAKNEAIVNLCRIEINRGKDRQWIGVKVVKDFDKKTKTFARIDTGEIVRTSALTEEDMQTEMKV
jgi:hypothetical protein